MKRQLFATITAVLMAGVACADEPTSGVYVGGSVGSAALELEDSESNGDFKGDDTAFKVVAGYRILKWLAVEGSYADYGQPEDTVFGLPLRADFNAIYAAALGMLPLGNFDLFAKAGVVRWDGSLESRAVPVEVKEDNVDPLIGIGAQYRMDRFALRAEFEGLLLSFDDDGDDESDGDDWIDFVSIGFTYTF